MPHLTPVIATVLSSGLLIYLLGVNREHLRNPYFVVFWTLGSLVVLLPFWMMLIGRLTGRLKPLPADDSSGSNLESTANAVPPHPSHNRKKIIVFYLVVGLTAAAVYGLAQIRRLETIALYVLALVPLLGVMAIGLLRTVRCPHCRVAMTRVRKMQLGGREWEVLRCPHSHGEWRVEKPIRPPP